MTNEQISDLIRSEIGRLETKIDRVAADVCTLKTDIVSIKKAVGAVDEIAANVDRVAETPALRQMQEALKDEPEHDDVPGVLGRGRTREDIVDR